MKHILRCLFLGVAVTLLPLAAPAQAPGAVTSFDAAFAKLFGDIKGFSARAEVVAKERGQDTTLEAEFAMLDDKVRMDMDLSKVKGAAIPAEMAGELKKMGMDKMATLVDKKAKRLQLVYPNLKAYADMPIPKEQADKLDQEVKMERTELGKEKVGDHDCVKYRYTVTEADGAKREILTWQAPKLKDFPVKINSKDKDTDITMLFKDVKLEKPAADLFALPEGYTKYGSLMEMMQAVMMRQMMQQR